MPTLADEVQGMEALTATDRCDRCGGQAYVRVEVPNFEDHPLLFCAHHAREHKDGLREKGCIVVADERSKLSAVQP